MRAPSWLVFCVSILAACASGHPAEAPDAGYLPLPPDPGNPMLKGFGEPCLDKKECQSNICILVGTSGQCTRVCPPECPGTYGCFDVTGVTVEGQVASVCVPTSNQLCTPCTQDSECTLLGADKCVTYPDGDRACARDCERVSCPTGFSCQNVAMGGVNYKQCISDSNACDCTAANPGATQSCNITTPFSTCMGSQACGGASGWGSCQPPSPNDDPDATYADSNCDGIDGDRARAIFVSLGGLDSTSCGLDYTSPCQHISYGITRAVATGRPHVYVQHGLYTGGLTMVNGVSVFGGYSINWKRDSYSMPGHTVTITGGSTAVRFDAITAPTWLDNVIVQSAGAGTTGGSSMGILVTSSQNVELRRVLVQPGAGGPGVAGGIGATGADGNDGARGNPGCENSSGTSCSHCARPVGGAGGTSPCGRDGGYGGQPGGGANNGYPGNDSVDGTPGGAGAMCSGDRSCDGTTGMTGANGGGGGTGTGGGALGTFSGFMYLTANGGTGTLGGHGNGGGGGGGGGGGNAVCDSYGSSGGGGGGGGCGGAGGFGGSGGGGSFGVIAVDSQVLISGSLVTAGTGGMGGAGGTGGNGGGGGSGGGGGAYGGTYGQDDGGDGAFGGRGGAGGPGGGGGGGGGGPAIAVVCLGSSTSTVTVNGSTLTGGTGGAGGAGNGATGSSAMSLGCPF